MQERWTNVAETCVKAAEEVVGRKQSEKKSGNKEIKELSEKQKSIRNDMNAANTKEEKEKLHKQRNKVLKEIYSKRKEEEERRSEKWLRRWKNTKMTVEKCSKQ